MTAEDDNRPERENDDIVAAEYVLGVLPADERQAVARRAENDTAFARLIDAWEMRLAPLAAGYAEIEVPAAVKAAIDKRLFGSRTGETRQDRSGLWWNIAFWRGLAVVAVAALALYVAISHLAPPAPPPESKLVASLTAEGSDIRYVAIYDSARNEVRLSQLAGETAAGKDLELWVIEGKNAPVSLGVIPPGATARLVPVAALRQKLAQGAVLAISLEPTGGSPTGQPTGPVVAAGDLKNI